MRNDFYLPLYKNLPIEDKKNLKYLLKIIFCEYKKTTESDRYFIFIEDLIQEGFIAYYQTKKTFDVKRGYNFFTYATAGISGHLKRYINKLRKYHYKQKEKENIVLIPEIKESDKIKDIEKYVIANYNIKKAKIFKDYFLSGEKISGAEVAIKNNCSRQYVSLIIKEIKKDLTNKKNLFC